MKITKFYLLGIAIILFSCNKDDDPKPTIEGMVGAWSLTGIDYSGSTTTTTSGITLQANFTGTGKDIDLTTTFNVDPNTVTSEGSYIIVLKTTLAGQTTTDEIPFDGVFTDGTWTLEGKTLTVTDDDISQEATIVSQTNTTLKLRVDVDQTESIGGISVREKVKAVYTFQKQ